MSTISFADLMRMQAAATGQPVEITEREHEPKKVAEQIEEIEALNTVDPTTPDEYAQIQKAPTKELLADSIMSETKQLAISIHGESAASTLNPAQQRALDSFMARANLIVDEASAVLVQSPEDLERAASMRQDILQAVDLLEAFKRPEINKHHAAHRAALDELRRLTDPWRRADTILKTKQDHYQRQVQEEKEKERRQIEEMLARAQHESIAAQIEEATQAGDDEKVGEILARPAAPVSIPFVAQPVKAAGTTGRMKTTVRVVDVSKLSHSFLLATIAAEVAEKGECKWLMAAINKAVKREGKHATAVVGDGSIEIGQEVSTGRRRRTGR